MFNLVGPSYRVLRGSLIFTATLVLFLGSCAPVFGEEGSSAPVSEAEIFASSLDKLKEGVVDFELSNGLRVVMYRRPQAPIFTGHIWVRVGGVDEAPGITGIAHMLEHMAFKGTEVIGTKDYAKERVLLARLEELIGDDGKPQPGSEEEIAQLESQLRELWIDNEFSRIYNNAGGVGLNAGTAKDYTFYTVALPSVAFDLWCWVESDRLLHPVFRQFYKEREVVMEERRTSYDDNPEGLLYETFLATAFASHPNRLPVIGWRSDLARLTATDVQQFYDTYYRPDNMVIALVGDLDPQKVRPMLERYFGRLKRPKTPLPKVTNIEEPQRGEKTAVVEYDAEPSILIGYHKPTFPNPDDAYFTVLHELLAGSRSSLFERVLVQEKKIVSSIYTSEAPGSLFPPVFMIGATPTKGVSYERVRAEIDALLDRVRRDGFSEEQLASAKRRVQMSFLTRLDSNSGLVYTLGSTHLLWKDWRVFFDFYNDVLSTTNEDIKRIVAQYLVRRNRTVAWLERPAGSAAGEVGR